MITNHNALIYSIPRKCTLSNLFMLSDISYIFFTLSEVVIFRDKSFIPFEKFYKKESTDIKSENLDSYHCN